MKRFFFLPLMVCITMAGIAQQKEFIISGHVTGLADGLVRVTTTQREAVVIASDSVRDGKFEVRGSVEEPGLYMLVMSNEQPQHIYLENAAYTVTGNQKQIKHVKISGSSLHDDFVELNKIFNPMMGELGALSAQFQKEPNQRKREAMMPQIDSIMDKIQVEITAFVSARPASHVSPWLLWITSQVTPDVLQLEKNFNLLDENLKKEKIARDLGEYIKEQKIGYVGTEAVDFTQNDTSGKAVSLSSFKGRYVLVDFWASWCGPCRKENPNLVKAYNKFKDKNFTILGVSLDQQRNAWINAIHKDRLAWYHVSDLQFWNNEAARLYKINSIPGNFLVDPNGKIIAKDLRGEDLEKVLEEVIGK